MPRADSKNRVNNNNNEETQSIQVIFSISKFYGFEIENKQVKPQRMNEDPSILGYQYVLSKSFKSLGKTVDF